MIERPSTKLHAPPGGKSSFSLGGDWNEPVKPVSSAKANHASSISFGNEDDRFSQKKVSSVPAAETASNATPSVTNTTTAANTNSAKGSSMGSILSGTNTAEPSSARRGYNNSQSSTMANLLSGEENQSQPLSSRGRRQAPGGTSTLVLG